MHSIVKSEVFWSSDLFLPIVSDNFIVQLVTS